VTTPNTVWLSYNSYVTQLCDLAVLQTTIAGDGSTIVPVDPDLVNLLPQAINYAELRIQRDLDLEQSVTNNSSLSLTSGNNLLTMDVNAFITVQSMSYVSGTVTQRILPTSRAFINEVYPDSSVQGPPVYFSPFGGDASSTGGTSQLFLFGPTPDQSYALSINGTVRMISLNSFNSAPNSSTGYTFISAYLPDLLLMASMVYVSGFQRNFGRQSDDPAMAQSYESQYQALLKGAMTEENRRKLWASAWTALSIPTTATANR
jgi:hypothetical protein